MRITEKLDCFTWNVTWGERSNNGSTLTELETGQVDNKYNMEIKHFRQIFMKRVLTSSVKWRNRVSPAFCQLRYSDIGGWNMFKNYLCGWIKSLVWNIYLIIYFKMKRFASK